MKLFTATLASGGTSMPTRTTVYVVAESYASVEIILFSKANTFWGWNHSRRIEEIKEMEFPILIQETSK